MLAENHAELAQALQDAFEDAVLMGVDEQAMRRILTGMVEGLESPKRARPMRRDRALRWSAIAYRSPRWRSRRARHARRRSPPFRSAAAGSAAPAQRTQPRRSDATQRSRTDHGPAARPPRRSRCN